MTQQFSLFEMQEKTILTDKQRRISTENPFFGFFDQLAPEKIVSEVFEVGKFYSLSEHPLLEAFYTAQTIALENIYRELDSRFLDICEGSFQLTTADGASQKIRFRYEPDYYVFDKRERCKTPTPRLEFFSDEPSIISNTGYRNEFMQCVPYWKTRTMEELVEFKAREISQRDDFKILFV